MRKIQQFPSLLSPNVASWVSFVPGLCNEYPCGSRYRSMWECQKESPVSSHLEQSSEDYQDPNIWLILSTLILFSPSCFVAFVLPVFLNKMPSVLM